MPSQWQLSQWQEAENEWERLLVVGGHCRSTENSAGPSSVPGLVPTIRANTPRCSEAKPQPSSSTPKPRGSPTGSGTTCLGNPVTSCSTNTKEYGLSVLDTGDEDIDADGDSRAPTPWPERWYKGGSELGLQRFAAEVMANCQGHHGDTEDIDDDIDAAQCSIDNDTGHHQQQGTGAATTTGTSSASSQKTAAGNQIYGNHPTKRPRTSDDGGNEEDRPPKRQDAKGPGDNEASPREFYACPYQKRNPQQSPFCGMPHGSKRDFGWSTVSRVK